MRKIIGINIGKKEMIQVGKHMEATGIRKKSITRAMIGRLGVAGDHIESEKHHGGPDQAVYVYSLDDYKKFEQAWALNISPGMFGENLTVTGLTSNELAIGDRLVFKNVVLEVTSPRIPCATFAAHMLDGAFVAKFIEIGQPGVYCRVLAEGVLEEGESFKLEACQNPVVTIRELFENYYNKAPIAADLLRMLQAPLAIRARKDVEKKLARLAD